MSLETTYNRVGALYDLLDAPFELGIYHRMRELALSQLRDASILEIGVGTGKNLAYYHESNTITGIDISSKMLSKAQKRAEQSPASVELVQKSIHVFSPERKFDVIIASFVLYLLDDLEPIVSKLAELLIKQGRIIIIEYRRPDTQFAYALSKLLSKVTQPLYGLDFTRIDTLSRLQQKFSLRKYQEIVPQWLYIAELTASQ